MAAKVKLYALSTCSHCRNAKEFLNKNNVEYDMTEVDKLTGDERRQTIEQVRQLNPECSFPTLIIDGRVIVGFKPDDIKTALGL